MGIKRHKIKLIILLLIFVVIVLGIIISIKYLNKRINQDKDENIKTNMLLIQAKVKLIKGVSNVNQNTDNYIGENLEESDNQELKDFIKNMDVEEDSLKDYYIIRKEHIESMGISDDIQYIDEYTYIVNYDTAEVFIKDGILVNGELKYRLSELLNKKDKKRWILYNRIGAI